MKFTRIASGKFQLNGIPWVSTKLFSLKFIGIMQLISCECALHRFRRRPPNWTLLIKVIFKFTLALKQWRVCTISSAITLLHLRIHSSKNYSLISLHVSTLISSIISPTNTLQMMNQFIQLTLQFLHFIPMIQPTSLKFFYIFLILYASPRFLPPPPRTKHAKGPPAENDRRPEREPEGPTVLQNRRTRRAAPTAPVFQLPSSQGTVGATADGCNWLICCNQPCRPSTTR